MEKWLVISPDLTADSSIILLLYIRWSAADFCVVVPVLSDYIAIH